MMKIASEYTSFELRVMQTWKNNAYANQIFLNAPTLAQQLETIKPVSSEYITIKARKKFEKANIVPFLPFFFEKHFDINHRCS